MGIDGSPSSTLAIKTAFEEASYRRADLVALHTWSDRELIELPGIDWSEVEAEEQRLTSEVLAGWQERYPDVTVTTQLVCDRPARALVDASRKGAASRGRKPRPQCADPDDSGVSEQCRRSIRWCTGDRGPSYEVVLANGAVNIEAVSSKMGAVEWTSSQPFSCSLR